MKKVGEIMKDMGFNPEASEGTQKAFIKYLLRVANKNKHVPEPFFYDEAEKNEQWQELKTHSKGHKAVSPNIAPVAKAVNPHKHEQLCFPFDEKKSDSEAS